MLSSNIIRRVLGYWWMTTDVMTDAMRDAMTDAPYWIFDDEEEVHLLPKYMFTLKILCGQLESLVGLDISVTYLICPLDSLWIGNIIPHSVLILDINRAVVASNDIMILNEIKSKILLYKRGVLDVHAEIALKRKLKGITYIKAVGSSLHVIPYRYKGYIYIYLDASITYDTTVITREVMNALADATQLDLGRPKPDSYTAIIVCGMQILMTDDLQYESTSNFRYVLDVSPKLILKFDDVFLMNPRGYYTQAANISLENCCSDIEYQAINIHLKDNDKHLELRAPNVKFINIHEPISGMSANSTASSIFDQYSTLEKISIVTNPLCKHICYFQGHLFTKVICLGRRHEYLREHISQVCDINGHPNMSEYTRLSSESSSSSDI